MDHYKPLNRKETQESIQPKESYFLPITEFEEFKKRFNVGFIGDFIKLERCDPIIEDDPIRASTDVDEKKDDTPKLSNEWETMMKLEKIKISS